MGKRVTELRSLTVDELKEEESRLRKELFNLRFQRSTGELENPLRIRQVKIDIARVLTLITEKQKDIGK